MAPPVPSSIAKPALRQRPCSLFFPDTFPEGSSPLPKIAQTNVAYEGWNVHIDRLFFANGQRMHSLSLSLPKIQAY